MKDNRIRMPKSRCLDCGKLITAASRLDDDRSTPDPGDVAVCIDCGHIQAYADDLTLRPLTDDEMVEIAGDREIIDTVKAIKWANDARQGKITEVKPGVYRFVCMDCQHEINSLGSHPKFPICQLCRFIREFGDDMPEAEKQRLRERR
jgi:hypothetical protein